MNSSGFMSGSVLTAVLHFPEKIMLRQMSRPGLHVSKIEEGRGVMIAQASKSVYLRTKEVLFVPVLKVGRLA